MNAEGHKLLSSSDAVNNKFTSALMIPNHTISWAVYEHLGGEADIEARFYKFNNPQINSSFYALIIVPKIGQFANFTPSLMLLEQKSYEVENNVTIDIVSENLISNIKINNLFPFTILMNYQIMINQNYNETIHLPLFMNPLPKQVIGNDKK